jgi:hypothetical protein
VLDLTEIAGEVLTDTRTGKNGRHSLIAQLRQSVFGPTYAQTAPSDRRARPRAVSAGPGERRRGTTCSAARRKRLPQAPAVGYERTKAGWCAVHLGNIG